MCQEVKAAVSKGTHFAVYPERKALWDAISASNGLLRFLSAAKTKFIQLYLCCGKGADKSCHLICEWLKYMVSHTVDKNGEAEGLWSTMIVSYSGEITEETIKVIVCDILHAIQDHLTAQIAKQLDRSRDNGRSMDDEDDMDDSSNDHSDDIALFRMGGWEILSAKRFRENYMKQYKEKQNNYKYNDIKEEGITYWFRNI